MDAGMRRSLWNVVNHKQGGPRKHKQKDVCVQLLDKLRREGAFDTALQQLGAGIALGEVLRETLWVHNKFTSDTWR